MPVKPQFHISQAVRHIARRHPLLRGCAAHWMFNQGGGTTAYDSIGNYDGTLAGSGGAFVPGPVGPVFDTNAMGYVDFPETQQIIPDGTPAYTIAAWFYIRTVTANNRDIFAKNFSSTANGTAYSLGMSTTDFYARIGNGTAQQINSAPLITGEWVFGTAVWNGGVLTLWINGVPNSSPLTVTLTGTVPSGNVGASESIATGFETLPIDAQISDVWVYNSRALSREEILTLYYDRYLPYRWAAEQVRRRNYLKFVVTPSRVATMYYRLMR